MRPQNKNKITNMHYGETQNEHCDIVTMSLGRVDKCHSDEEFSIFHIILSFKFSLAQDLKAVKLRSFF